MIRLVQLLRAPAGMVRAEFLAYWRDIHGPLVASLQTPLNLLRHTQLHPDPANQGLDTAAAQARGGMLPPSDGIAESWWRSEEALLASLESPEGRAAHEALAQSEARFVDASTSTLYLAREFPQVSAQPDRPLARLRSGVMKLHFALRPLPSLTDAAAHAYWLHQHGPLVRSHALARGMLAYNQVHRDETPSALALARRLADLRGGVGESFLGHAEAWFDRVNASAGGPERDAAAAAALADEARFIDWPRSTILVGKELVFVEREWG